MKLLDRRPPPPAPGAAAPRPAKPLADDPQAAPVLLPATEASASGLLKVDLAVRIGKCVVVAGWRTAPVELGLRCDSGDLVVRRFESGRDDVAQHLGLGGGENLGFVLVADGVEPGPVRLTLAGAERALQLSAMGSVDRNLWTLAAPALPALREALPAAGAGWQSLFPLFGAAEKPSKWVKGHIDTAVQFGHTGYAVVSGWFVQPPGAVAWIEDEDGRVHSLEGAYRTHRADVLEAVGPELAGAASKAGFIARLEGIPTDGVLRLKVLDQTGAHTLSEGRANALPSDPQLAASWLFGLGTPLTRFVERLECVDQAIIEELVRIAQSQWPLLQVMTRALGTAPAAPKVSIIIPLYGRADFVEHQLIEFAKDAWLREHAEIVYVMDDKRLVDDFVSQADFLHDLYQVPFRWVWGSTNRGFSGANNLGAEHARGEHLLFLNSDAFPQKPGWLEALLRVLEDRPDVGAVGPRLVFADGSIQHAGMEFRRRNDLGIWINHHPCMGLAPKLDPHKHLAMVPAVTGACLAMRRVDFDAIGGWDTGYLIGDFEDSDLCLKLRAQGKQIAYLPDVQLTHLERQSFRLLGQGEFRVRVTILNALRHQQRWNQLIETSHHG